MTDETTPHSPAPRWVFALSVLVFLPPAAIGTFFLLDAYGLLETYQQFTVAVLVFLGVVWCGAILYGIVRMRTFPHNVLLAALAVVAFAVFVISIDQSAIRVTMIIFASIVGVVAFGVIYFIYASSLLSRRFELHERLSLAQALTLVIIATTTGIIGATGADAYFNLYTIRDRATVDSIDYLLATFDEVISQSYVQLFACNQNGLYCDLIRTIGEDSATVYDTPDQITWEVGENDGITIITILRDDVPIHTEYIE